MFEQEKKRQASCICLNKKKGTRDVCLNKKNGSQVIAYDLLALMQLGI